MNQKAALIFSISIHIVILLFFLLLTPKSEVIQEEKRINIELVTKKEEKSNPNRDIKGKNVDIKSGTTDVKLTISEPQSNNYIQSTIKKSPDLVLQNSPRDLNKQLEISGFDMLGFEDNLLDLMPLDEIIEDESDQNITISWEGDTRDIQGNSYIDFSLFPKDSFTGVGVEVEFMVNPEGEVFSVSVKAPGSGSIDFDILIKQYVTKFVFNKSETTSKGEIFIVYKK